jgi:arylformamidase
MGGTDDMETSSLAHEVIDISLPITPNMPIWPGDPAPGLKPVLTLERDGLQVSQLVLSTHTGTHLDAPRHFIPGGCTIDQLDLGILVGVCRVIEVVSAATSLSRTDLQRFELQPDERVLVKTRNSRRPAARTFVPDFAALGPSAAAYLCDQGVRLVGIDGPSIDVWDASDFPCHKHLLAAGILIVENLVLRDVVPGVYGLIAVPLNIAGADGCPVRAVLTPARFLPPSPA